MTKILKVLGVTSWQTDCGIAAYAELLKDACAAEGLPVEFDMRPEALDPAWLEGSTVSPDLIWLNHHDGLHSRWLPEHVDRMRYLGIPVAITYHDTYETNGEKAKALLAAVTPPDASPLKGSDLGRIPFVVHEPVTDLPGALYLRQGIPDPTSPFLRSAAYYGDWVRPVLGTVGFPFPWKNYDELARVTTAAGWGLRLIAPRSTVEDAQRWHALNPWTEVIGTFIPATGVVQYLTGCTATAFMYQCANSGTSGAIRQGIAARRPVYAMYHCRQFRDLQLVEDREESRHLIRWCFDFGELLQRLKTDPITEQVHAGMVYLAERDSWRRQARRYVELFQQAMGGLG